MTKPPSDTETEERRYNAKLDRETKRHQEEMRAILERQAERSLAIKPAKRRIGGKTVIILDEAGEIDKTAWGYKHT